MCSELLSEQRYGLSATSCRGMIAGEMQDIIVVLGGFTMGGYAGEVNSLIVLKWTPQEGEREAYHKLHSLFWRSFVKVVVVKVIKNSLL